MSNIIRIKRRLPDSNLGTALPSLSGGELAFNEINTTLYYGASSASGTTAIAIGGAGTFATNTLVDALTSSLQTQISNLGSGSSTAIDNLSSHVDTYFVEKVESDAVTLNGGLTVASGLYADTLDTTGNASIGGNLLVTGDLQVLGATTTIETETTTTSAFNITNHGGTTALTVTQVNGSNDVAEFKDGTDTALIVKGSGNVGVGVFDPSEKLTVAGNLSASGNVYAVNGDFTGTLDVDGATTLGSTLTVTNGTTLNSTLDVVGAATFASTVSAQGSLEVDSTLTVDGSTTLNGSTTINNTLNATGAVDFDSTLNVDAATTLGSTLYVTDASTFASSISAQGAVEFDSTLTVDGGTTLNSTLTIVGNTTTSGNITGNGVTEIVDFVIDCGNF
jgi:hypothetical protein